MALGDSRLGRGRRPLGPWDHATLRRAARSEGAYLLRAHWTEKDPAKLWQTCIQLTEAAFRALKSEIKARPIWHWTEPRVPAHRMAAFLGYCLVY